MEKIIDRTESYCCDCRENHTARIVDTGKHIIFIVECPVKKRKIVISEYPEIYRMLRRKSRYHYNRNFVPQSWGNQIELLNRCNFHCPVCYASANESTERIMPLREVISLAKKLQKQGVELISLSGGEPTLYPELFILIKALKQKGFIVNLSTNGSMLAADSDFALRLKRSGLEYCYIQFDSLDPLTHAALRGNDYIPLKKHALQNAFRAKLPLATITTTVKKNIQEAGNIVQYLTNYSPVLNICVFAAAGNAGRFALPESQLVTRDDIIHSLLASNFLPELTIDDFIPFPRFLPFRVNLHPDCGAVLPLYTKHKKPFLLDRLYDVNRFCRLLSRPRKIMRKGFGHAYMAVCFLLSMRVNRLRECFLVLWGMLMQKGVYGILIVAIDQFMNTYYQDVKRLGHCATYHVLDDGTRVPMCMYHHPDKSRYSKTDP
ncbi:MAG: radical SAM protein [Spirochaetales bacterium]|nr:radical SAM protein [Spirochaetales bacterium]